MAYEDDTERSVLARINDLKAAIAEGVIAAEIRRRSWRVQQLQEWADDILALRAVRKVLYAGQLGEGYEFLVADRTAELKALAEGCRALPPGKADAPEYPKLMRHPGFTIGGHTGMVVKEYRGKNAEQEIWKSDAALAKTFAHLLKQAAIEEGQWTEKRQLSGGLGARPRNILP